MSTRALIVRDNKDNSFDAIFLHWDGYPAHCGTVLKTCYTTNRKVDNLISLGNLDSIGRTMSRKSGTKAMYRDCGMPYEKPFHATTKEELSEYADKLGVAYIYCWNGTKWQCAACCGCQAYTELVPY